MTQKEYREEIMTRDKTIKDLRALLDKEEEKTSHYEDVLEKYFIVSEQLRSEQNEAHYLRMRIDSLNTIIAQYEKTLNRVNLEVN